MAKYSVESNTQKETPSKKQEKEYRQMEELDENLRSIQKYNHKLIRKHGHDDLEKLTQKGIFNYADFMDVETNKKLKKWRKQRRRDAAQISD